MNIAMRHEFPCTSAELWTLIDDPEVERRVRERSGVSRDIVEQRDDGATEYTRKRCVSSQELPRIVALFVGTRHVTYEQETWRDLATNDVRWNIIPGIMPSRVTASGTAVYRPVEGGCERVIRGRIAIRLPIFNKRMERRLRDSIHDAYRIAAEVMKEMLAERRS